MYRYADKHIELFKKIPFSEFISNSDFISKVISQPDKYATYENILKCYYFIADEMWDPLNIKPAITDETTKYCFYDSVRKRYDFVIKYAYNPEPISNKRLQNRQQTRYKPIKLFNGIFNKDGQNKHYKRYQGLIAQPRHKSKQAKAEAYKTRDMFISYAYIYNNDYKFYKRNEYEMPTEWAEHLYALLSKLYDQTFFFYKQRGSTILTQEAISILSNQFLFLISDKRIKN